jgi:hypothetical protein
MRKPTLQSNATAVMRCQIFTDAPSFDRGIKDGHAGDLRRQSCDSLPSPKENRLRMEIAMLTAARDPRKAAYLLAEIQHVTRRLASLRK